MERLLPLLLLVTLTGCLLPSSNRSSNQQRLQELSVPSQVERIEVAVFEQDNAGKHQISKRFEIRKQHDIETICSVLRDKKIRSYYATEPVNETILAIRGKGNEVFSLFLSGNHFFVNDGYIEISDAEKEHILDILNKTTPTFRRSAKQ